MRLTGNDEDLLLLPPCTLADKDSTLLPSLGIPPELRSYRQRRRGGYRRELTWVRTIMSRKIVPPLPTSHDALMLRCFGSTETSRMDCGTKKRASDEVKQNGIGL